MTAFSPQHNHEVTELEFKFHPRVRKLDPETEKEIASNLQMNASRKLVQQNYKEKTGKTILMKDLHNIATHAKQTSQEGIITSSSEVQDLFNWLTQQYPGFVCEFVVNENNILSGLFIQDAEMKSTFSSFPEGILED